MTVKDQEAVQWVWARGGGGLEPLLRCSGVAGCSLRFEGADDVMS